MAKSILLSLFMLTTAAASDDYPAPDTIAITEGTWTKGKTKTYCSNRIVVGTGSFEECLSIIANDQKCEKVTYSNHKNDKCFCVPAGGSCTESAAGWTDLYTFTPKPPPDTIKISEGTWSLEKTKTFCKNRIVVGTGTFDECLSKIANDDKCDGVTYSNSKNDKCFCVPKGETCDEGPAGWTHVYTFTAAPAGPYMSCDEQENFNVMMCNSFMCNKCILDWCMQACQETQLKFPTCRCEAWPEARKSYSGGDFASKGQFGDVGDYAKAAASFLSKEITQED